MIDDEMIESYLKLKIYCVTIQETDYIQNEKAVNNSTSLDLMLVYCNPEKQKCAKNIEDIRLNTYIQFYYLNSYIDSLDFNNPVKYYFGTLDHQISKNFLKRRFILIANNFYYSDNGWILEDERTTNFIQIESANIEINSVPANYPNDALWINFTSPNFFFKFSRSYMKVQDLFAKIGGIINALMIIAQMIFSHYLRFIMLLGLRRNISFVSNGINNSNVEIRVDRGNSNLLIYNSTMKLNEFDNKIIKLQQKIVILNQRIKDSNFCKIEENKENLTEENKASHDLIRDNDMNKDSQIIKKPKLFKIAQIRDKDHGMAYENLKNNDLPENTKGNQNFSEFTNEVNTRSKICQNMNILNERKQERIKSINNYLTINDNEKNSEFNKEDLKDKNINGIFKKNFNNEVNTNEFVGYFHYICYKLICNSKKLNSTIKMENEMYALLDIRNFLNYISNEYQEKMQRDNA